MRHILVIGLMLLVWSCGFTKTLFEDPAKAQDNTATAAEEQVPMQQAKATQSTPTPAPAATPATAPAMTTPAAPVSVAQAPQGVVTAAPAPAPVAVAPTPVASNEESSMDRVERRKMKAQRFAASIDSLVTSHSFRFLPNSMQELPGGWMQLIYNELYFVAVFKDHVEVHMPTIRGGMVQYYEILNFDTFEVRNYQASKTQFGWNVSFNLLTNNDTVYTINMLVNTLTGETVLNLLTLSNTVRYVGYIQSVTKD